MGNKMGNKMDNDSSDIRHKNLLVCHGPNHLKYPFLLKYIREGTWYVDPAAKSESKNLIKLKIDDEKIIDIVGRNILKNVVFVYCPNNVYFNKKNYEQNLIVTSVFDNIYEMLDENGIIIIDSFYHLTYNLFTTSNKMYYDKEDKLFKWFIETYGYNPLTSRDNMKKWTNIVFNNILHKYDIKQYSYYKYKKFDIIVSTDLILSKKVQT